MRKPWPGEDSCMNGIQLVRGWAPSTPDGSSRKTWLVRSGWLGVSSCLAIYRPWDLGTSLSPSQPMLLSMRGNNIYLPYTLGAGLTEKPGVAESRVPNSCCMACNISFFPSPSPLSTFSPCFFQGHEEKEQTDPGRLGRRRKRRPWRGLWWPPRPATRHSRSEAEGFSLRPAGRTPELLIWRSRAKKGSRNPICF